MNKKDQVEEGNYNLLKIAHWNLEVLLLLGDRDCVNHPIWKPTKKITCHE